ncbi:DUF2178 domain-containing protein [Methanogenium organophilum]|uniref:DUF2178 domain-containing protein n=1 Tax=Methanogenium organophilum TaxID=2199 RepID=A0A9X9S431_METOG|nr:DUF2178 domain-containing protein [Methanogenium organophilum]WAI01413.1 DUF2178 domain-containing protein [Methanogenium organophilum]
MKKRTYLLCIALISAGLIITLGVGLTSANMIVPVIAVIGGIGIIALCHHRLTEVTEDELSERISGKAAICALEITIIVAAVAFAVLMVFSFNGGFGSGLHTYDNGSIRIHYGVFSTPPDPEFIYDSSYFIADPTNMTGDDINALDEMFAKGHRIRDSTLAFGAALGIIAVLLAILYGAFLSYYNRKYGV